MYPAFGYKCKWMTIYCYIIVLCRCVCGCVSCLLLILVFVAAYEFLVKILNVAVVYLRCFYTCLFHKMSSEWQCLRKKYMTNWNNCKASVECLTLLFCNLFSQEKHIQLVIVTTFWTWLMMELVKTLFTLNLFYSCQNHFINTWLFCLGVLLILLVKYLKYVLLTAFICMEINKVWNVHLCVLERERERERDSIHLTGSNNVTSLPLVVTCCTAIRLWEKLFLWFRL
jgi:hypothetical protein